MAPSAQCSGCSGEFSWSVAESTQQLFPLLCGHIFCRVCLGRQAQVALSRRIAPLRCCQKVVPHDFVRMVLAYEEDVYYSFLLNGGGKLPATQNNGTSTPVFPLAVSDDTEMKRPAKSETNNATTTGASSVISLLDDQDEAPLVAFPSQPPRPRYLTRGSKARRIQVQNSKKSGGTVSPAPAKPPVALSSQPCQMCGIGISTSQIKALCGHALCHNCVETGVRGYLNAPNSGAPVSCCDQVLPLHLVNRVIPRKELTKYAKLVFKYATTMTNTTTTNTRGIKRKTDPESMLATAPAKGKARTASSAKHVAPTKKGEQKNNQKHPIKRECISCWSLVSVRAKWLVGPCGHGYCRSCFMRMAKASLASRDQVPIRCCSKEFPMEYVELVLNKHQFTQYERYLAERDPHSSTLQSDQDYAKVVRQVKGKQCPVCGIGVVKLSGCHAMQCFLGHFFCWNCLHTQCICGKIYRYD